MAFRSEATDLCQITEDWFLPLKRFGLVQVLLKRDGLLIWCHISSDVESVKDVKEWPTLGAVQNPQKRSGTGNASAPSGRAEIELLGENEI